MNAARRGYRLYSESDVRKAEFIRTARNIGFSLEDIAVLLSIRIDKASHTCQEVTDITNRKLLEVNEKIGELTSMQKTLQTLLASCCGGPEDATHCSIMEALDEHDKLTIGASGKRPSKRSIRNYVDYFIRKFLEPGDRKRTVVVGWLFTSRGDQADYSQ